MSKRVAEAEARLTNDTLFLRDLVVDNKGFVNYKGVLFKERSRYTCRRCYPDQRCFIRLPTEGESEASAFARPCAGCRRTHRACGRKFRVDKLRAKLLQAEQKGVDFGSDPGEEDDDWEESDDGQEDDVQAERPGNIGYNISAAEPGPRRERFDCKMEFSDDASELFTAAGSQTPNPPSDSTTNHKTPPPRLTGNERASGSLPSQRALITPQSKFKPALRAAQQARPIEFPPPSSSSSHRPRVNHGVSAHLLAVMQKKNEELVEENKQLLAEYKKQSIVLRKHSDALRQLQEIYNMEE